MKKTIGFLSAIALSSAAYADNHGVSVDGFFDGGMVWTKDGSPAAQLTINDWAFHLKARNDKTSVMLDFGAMGATNTQVHLDQATINTKYDNGFNWTIGLFDRFLGYEGRDSNTWTFAQSSLISNVWANQAHGGLLFGYDLSEMLGLHILVANGGQSGNFDYPQFGFKLDSDMDGMGFGVGGVFESVGGELGYDMGVTLTSEMGSIGLAAEVAFTKAAGAENSGLAFGLTGTGSISEGTGFGARVEWGNEYAQIGGNASKALAVTVGPNFTMSEAGSVYVDYTLVNESDLESTSHGVSIAYVHSF